MISTKACEILYGDEELFLVGRGNIHGAKRDSPAAQPAKENLEEPKVHKTGPKSPELSLTTPPISIKIQNQAMGTSHGSEPSRGPDPGQIATKTSGDAAEAERERETKPESGSKQQGTPSTTGDAESKSDMTIMSPSMDDEQRAQLTKILRSIHYDIDAVSITDKDPEESSFRILIAFGETSRYFTPHRYVPRTLKDGQRVLICDSLKLLSSHTGAKKALLLALKSMGLYPA